MTDTQKIDEWDLTSTNQHRILKRRYEVAVVPTGAIEAHNLHLPEGQDFRHTTYVARRSCEMAWEKCQSVICLPTLPFGVDCNQMAYPLAIHVSQGLEELGPAEFAHIPQRDMVRYFSLSR